jgi:hypothetical protein
MYHLCGICLNTKHSFRNSEPDISLKAGRSDMLTVLVGLIGSQEGYGDSNLGLSQLTLVWFSIL